MTQAKGLGVDQGIPTLVMASASVDDVLAIAAFSVLLAVAVDDGNTGNQPLTITVLFQLQSPSLPSLRAMSRNWLQQYRLHSNY